MMLSMPMPAHHKEDSASGLPTALQHITQTSRMPSRRSLLPVHVADSHDLTNSQQRENFGYAKMKVLLKENCHAPEGYVVRLSAWSDRESSMCETISAMGFRILA